MIHNTIILAIRFFVCSNDIFSCFQKWLINIHENIFKIMKNIILFNVGDLKDIFPIKIQVIWNY